MCLSVCLCVCLCMYLIWLCAYVYVCFSLYVCDCDCVGVSLSVYVYSQAYFVIHECIFVLVFEIEIHVLCVLYDNFWDAVSWECSCKLLSPCSMIIFNVHQLNAGKIRYWLWSKLRLFQPASSFIFIFFFSLSRFDYYSSSLSSSSNLSIYLSDHQSIFSLAEMTVAPKSLHKEK